MKVLHVWDLAGVANIIAKFMDRLYGTESYVMSRKVFDEFGWNIYTTPMNDGATMFVIKALLKARKYDIIHVHWLDKIVPFLKILYHKPVVIGYYGTSTRSTWKVRRKKWSRADLILYSTQDLVTDETPKEAKWFPCPIDTDLFYPRPHINRGTAVTFEYEANDLVNQYARNYGLALTISKRNVPYLKMADFLSQYEFYIDVKRWRGKVTEALSKTGLEALACGCKVIRWDGQIMRELAPEHRAENAVMKLYEIYQSLLKKG